MADAQSRKLPAKNVSGSQPISTPEAQGRGIVAAALLSFLKEIGGTQIWTEKDLSSALTISSSRAKEATAVLQLQGYIEPAGHAGKWRVSEQGQIVSGAKSPRFSRKSIEGALAGLRDRIKAANSDADAAYKIIEAVAFGDFLGDAARLQAADVGIRLVPKMDDPALSSAKRARCRARLPEATSRKSRASAYRSLRRLDELEISRAAFVRRILEDTLESVPAEEAVKNGWNGQHNPDGTVTCACNVKSIDQRAGPSET